MVRGFASRFLQVRKMWTAAVSAGYNLALPRRKVGETSDSCLALGKSFFEKVKRGDRKILGICSSCEGQTPQGAAGCRATSVADGKESLGAKCGRL